MPPYITLITMILKADILAREEEMKRTSSTELVFGSIPPSEENWVEIVLLAKVELDKHFKGM